MNEQQLPPLPKPAIANGPGSMFRFNYYTAEQMRDYARAVLAMSPKLASGTSLAANEKVPSRATDIATALALPGCERLREWAEIGPVQRAAVEEFAYALAANVPADLGIGWTGNPDADLALILLDRLDDQGDGNADRIEQLEGLVRKMAQDLAAKAAPAPEATLPNGLTEAETSASPSVAGLGAPAQAQQSAEPLPCPFCGHVGLDFADGSTHRWGLASCAGCGATCGETRRAYPPDDKWHANAIKDWNTRAKPEAQQPLGEDQLEAAYREIWRNKPAHFGFTTSDWITAGIRYAERAHGIGASGEASK